MHILIYDGSFEGFLTSVFEVYEYKLEPVQIIRDYMPLPLLFTNAKIVITDRVKAERVLKKLDLLIGKKGIHQLICCILTEKEDVEFHLLNVVKYALANPTANVLQNMADTSVLRLAQYTKMAGREKHRMEAFVRFKLTCDDIYFSEVEPDFNVLPLIAKHFKSRYQDQKWLIFDKKRHYGIYYDLQNVEYVEMNFNGVKNKQAGLEMLAKDEKLYATLWKTYFQSTNIKARKNTKLHLQHVPKRYWKYLTEKF